MQMQVAEKVIAACGAKSLGLKSVLKKYLAK